MTHGKRKRKTRANSATRQAPDREHGKVRGQTATSLSDPPKIATMKIRLSLSSLILLSLMVSCFLLWFGGIGYFLLLLTMTHWIAGIPILAPERFPLRNTKWSPRDTYTNPVKFAWVVTGIFWLFLTFYAFKEANASLSQILLIALHH